MSESKTESLLYANHLTAYPGYSASFAELTEVLVSRGGIYLPEMIEFGEKDGYKQIPFDPENIDRLSRKWSDQPNSPGWTLVRNKPVQVIVKFSRYLLDFESFSIHVQSDHFRTPKDIDEFVSINKECYSILRTAYGFIRLPEMVKTYRSSLGNVRLGIDLKRAIPDVYWATFLGPEYVEMFGRNKLLSVPCNKVEELHDGGVLLVLTPSPLDYVKDAEGFDRLRQRVKEHLGIEAFDNGDRAMTRRIPKFRYVDETRSSTTHIPSEEWKGDYLSQVDRDEWRVWLQNNRTLAIAFAQESSVEPSKLDFSPESLGTLDNYIQKLRETGVKPTVDFVMKVAAYVSQILINEKHANWSFAESETIPSLSLGEIHFSPLSRAEKAIFEGERFDLWFRFLVDELIPKVKTSNSGLKSQQYFH